MLYDLLQIIIALIVIVIMGVLAYSIYNNDASVFIEDATKSIVIKKKVKILDGTFAYDTNKTAVINTTFPYYGNYRDIVPSINQKGGAEYTYNFWIYMDTEGNLGSGNSVKTKVLFVKGSDTRIQYLSDNKNNCYASETGGWYLVKNPLVRVNIKSGKVSAIVTEFNTIKSVDAVHDSPEKINCSSSDINQKDLNMFGIYGLEGRTDLHGRWSMITLVVSETNPNSDIMFRNEAVVKMYLNGYEYFNKTSDAYYSSGSVTTAMRNNSGNLYINPDKTETDYSKLAISDLTYFNYALTDEEVISLHKAGFNKNTAAIPQEMDFDKLSSYDASRIETEKSNRIKLF